MKKTDFCGIIHNLDSSVQFSSVQFSSVQFSISVQDEDKIIINTWSVSRK